MQLFLNKEKKITKLISNSRARIFFVSILFFIILGTAFWLVYQNAEVMGEQINRDFNQQQSILAQQVASQIDANLQDIKSEIQTLIKFRSKNNVEAFKDQIGSLVERTKNKGVSFAGFLDSSNNVYIASPSKKELTDSEYGFISDTSIVPYNSVTLGPLSCELGKNKKSIVTSTITIRINGGAHYKEFLFIKINISYLVKLISSTIQSGKTGYAWIIDESGMFLYHPEDEFIGKNAFTVREKRKPYITFTKINEIMKNRMLQGKEGTGTYVSGWHRGIEREIKKLIAYTPIKSNVLGHGQRWSVAVVAPISEIEETIKKVYRQNLTVEATLIAGMFIFGFFIFIFQNHMSQTLTARVKQAEAEVHESEQIYRRVVAQAADLIYIFDLDMRLVLVNPLAESTFHQIFTFFYKNENQSTKPGLKTGAKSFQSRSKLYELFGPFQEQFIRVQIEKTITRQESHSFDHMVSLNERKIHFSSKFIPIRDEKGKIIHILGISRDNTEKLEVDQKIYNTEKLASIGTLAAGVAHELNNPLAVILGFTDLLIERFKKGTQEREDLEIIESSASHAKTIVENLLGFARITEGLEDYVDIEQSVKTVINIITNTLMTKKIKLVTDIADNLPRAKCDAREFQQILFNLINNSIAAIKEEGGGTLTISAYTTKNMKYICINIADTGIGIPDALKARIFDPFFTTKKVGKGTGLGLSLCYGIVNKYGGKITFKSISAEDVSNKPTGTTFSVLLPKYIEEKT